MTTSGRRLAAFAVIGLGAISIAGCGEKTITPTRAIPGDALSQGWSVEQRTAWYRGTQGSRLIPESWLLALEAADNDGRFMAPENFARFNYLPDPLPRPAGDVAWPIGFARDNQDDSKLKATKLRWYAGQGRNERWIGLGCAACHTAQIDINGTPMIVEGAPTLADFQGFTEALSAAMHATAANPGKFDRFAAAVLKAPDGAASRDTPANRALLKTAVTQWLALQDRLAWYNATGTEPGHPEKTVYGHGRLDAVGHILNKVAFLAAGENDGVPAEALRMEPNAPVSYPQIWNAPQHDRLQWDGIVPNDKIALGPGGKVDAGALVRNATEVIGVFADVDVKSQPGLGGFASSVDTESLIGLETLIGKLKSPVWPAAAGAIDRKLVIAGGRLFKQQCAGCHAPLAQDDLKTPIIAEMTPVWAPAGVDTDPWMACNTFTYEAMAGRLTGTKLSVIAGKPLPSRAPTREVLQTETIGVLLGRKWDVAASALKIALGQEEKIRVVPAPPPPPPPPPLAVEAPQQDSREARLQKCIDLSLANALDPPAPAPLAADADKAAEAAWIEAWQAWNKERRATQDIRLLLAYKARPLNGIWATAPYLHNGSVKSLYELLQPVEKRTKTFWVGNRKFDAREVGFVNQPSPVGSWFRVRDANDKDIHGNSNAGHDYGSKTLTEAERWALVEYMKTL